MSNERINESITKVVTGHKYGNEAREATRSILACFNVPEPLHMIPGYGNVVEAGALTITRLIDKAVQAVCQANLDYARGKEKEESDELQE